MKKVLSIVIALALLLAVGAVALGGGTDTYELALITDLGTINDKSFNQGAWEGLVKYAEEKGIAHKYYQPKEQGTQPYLDTIQLAVEGGAKLIVTPGYLFEEAIYMAQDMYPEVNFVLVDGNPHNADYSEYRTNSNVVGIVYAEEQSGFLAGYSIVKEAALAMAEKALVSSSNGFVQGAEYAAKEMGVGEVTINYHYTGGFAATPEAQALAASWYNDGIEAIFACGGAVGNSVMSAAAAAENKWVIGVDVDQSGESDRVITSAMKGLGASVYQAVTAHYEGNFPGGESWVLGADRDGVSLPKESSRFTKFTQEEYDAIFAKLVSGEITLVKDTNADGAAVAVTEIPVEVTKVTVVE